MSKSMNKRKKSDRICFKLRLDTDSAEALNKMAKAEGHTLSSYIHQRHFFGEERIYAPNELVCASERIYASDNVSSHV